MRRDAQVLCDFDVTNSGSAQANSRSIYFDLRMVSTSGRVFPRTDAFFVDGDGTPFTDSLITAGNRVRLVMVFEGIPDSYSIVTLAHGNDVVQGVPIAAQQPAPGAATSRADNPGRQ